VARRGEKVPAAVGTVTHGLVQREVAALHSQGSVLVVQQARSAAVGARRLGAEGLGLLLQEGGERTLGQASGRGRCDLLQRPKVDLGAGAGLAEGATGNDFSPLGRQVTDFLDLLRRESALRHEQSCLVLTNIYLVVFLLPCYHTPLRPAKGVLASERHRAQEMSSPATAGVP